MKRKAWIFAMASMVGLLGCEVLDDVRDALDEPLVQQTLGLTLAGVSPAADFRDTGNLSFDLVGQESGSDLSELASLGRGAMQVQVKNDDGTYSDCEHSGGETVRPHEYHALTLLLDGSGSMELAYPPSIHGDVCVTCPHDPSRERVGAAHELVMTIADASPRSPMAVAEFGPAPTSGFAATRLHSDFITDTSELQSALDGIEGYEPVGTPLYDSLAEMVDETWAAALDLEGALRDDRGEDITWGDGEDVPEDEREVARFVIVLSDGEDNASTSWNVDSVISLALDAGVMVYAVGLGPASASNAPSDVADPEQTQAVRNLQRLARETGGYYAAASNPAALGDLYDNLGMALTEGYTVETYSCIPKPTEDTPKEECDVPPVGSRIDGRLSHGDVDIPWVTVAN